MGDSSLLFSKYRNPLTRPADTFFSALLSETFGVIHQNKIEPRAKA